MWRDVSASPPPANVSRDRIATTTQCRESLLFKQGGNEDDCSTHHQSLERSPLPLGPHRSREGARSEQSRRDDRASRHRARRGRGGIGGGWLWVERVGQVRQVQQ